MESLPPAWSRSVYPRETSSRDLCRGRGRSEGERLNESSSEQIDLDNREAALLVGENDTHLRALEDLLDLRHQSARQPVAAGRVAARRSNAGVPWWRNCASLLRSGQDLDKATLELAASLSAGQSGVGPRSGEHRQRRHPGAPRTAHPAQDGEPEGLRRRHPQQHHHLRHRAGRHGQDLPGHGHGHFRPSRRGRGPHHPHPAGGGGRREAGLPCPAG